MKKDELLATLSENINNVFSVDGFKKILNRANSLTGFDTMNRILIHQQYDNAYDVKVADEWELKNRHVRKNAKPIYILMPITDVKYMDVESGVIIPDNELDLNSVELHEAISRGLIEKTKDIVDVQVIATYDIRQTYSNGNNKYTVTKPIVNMKLAFELFVGITSGSIQSSTVSKYDIDNNILYLRENSSKDEKYSTIVQAISQFICSYKLASVAKTTGVEITDWTEYELQLIEDSLAYSILTLLRRNPDIDLGAVNTTSNDKLLAIFNMVDILILDVTYRVKFEGGLNAVDMASHIEKGRKSEALLNIMEANMVLNKMKGA